MRIKRGGPTAVAVSALAVFATLLALVPSQASAQGHFSDTSQHFAHDAINHLMDRGVLGDPNSTWCGGSEFCPARPIARWMAAVWLTRALNDARDPSHVWGSRYDDLKYSDHWTRHVEWLAAAGFVLGPQDGTFGPHDHLTRAQMSALVKAEPTRHTLAGPAVALARGALVTANSCIDGGSDCPDETISRGEFAHMLAAMLQGDFNQTPTDAPSGTFWHLAQGVAAGNYHTCALRHAGRDDDKIACWGLNHHGQLDQPHPDYRYKVVASGGAHSCAIRRDDIADCWGLNNHGQTDVPDGRYKNIAAGDVSTCAIRTNHTLVCWGKDMGRLPPNHSYDNLDVGANHGCIIRRGNIWDSNRKRLYCWGDDTHGQAHDRPEHVDRDSGWNLHENSGRHYFGVGAGDGFTCAAVYEATSEGLAGYRRATQYLNCWGRDDHGQAPRRNTDGTFAVRIDGDTQIIEHMIGAGWRHGCALRSEDNGVYCWGDDSLGQLRHGEGATYLALSVGATHACGVKDDDTLACWGFDL